MVTVCTVSNTEVIEMQKRRKRSNSTRKEERKIGRKENREGRRKEERKI